MEYDQLYCSESLLCVEWNGIKEVWLAGNLLFVYINKWLLPPPPLLKTFGKACGHIWLTWEGRVRCYWHLEVEANDAIYLIKHRIAPTKKNYLIQNANSTDWEIPLLGYNILNSGGSDGGIRGKCTEIILCIVLSMQYILFLFDFFLLYTIFFMFFMYLLSKTSSLWCCTHFVP